MPRLKLYVVRCGRWIYNNAVRLVVGNFDSERPLTNKTLDDGENKRMLASLYEGRNYVLVPKELLLSADVHELSRTLTHQRIELLEEGQAGVGLLLAYTTRQVVVIGVEEVAGGEVHSCCLQNFREQGHCVCVLLPV